MINVKTIQNKIEDIWYFMEYRFNDILAWVRHRTTDKYHVIRTGLKPGYYDKDEQMLHVNFSLLVDLIEVEKAWLQTIFTEPENIGHKHPWWKRLFKEFRCKECGLAYLDWEMNLSNDVECHVSQSETAKEQYELYKWWTITRPNRSNPWETYKLELPKLDFEDSPDGSGNKVLPPPTKKTRSIIKKVIKLEAQQYQEDEKMLIRLMKIRRSLWT